MIKQKIKKFKFKNYSNKFNQFNKMIKIYIMNLIRKNKFFKNKIKNCSNK